MCTGSPVVPAATLEEIEAEYGSNLKLLECNSQVAELLTILAASKLSQNGDDI